MKFAQKLHDQIKDRCQGLRGLIEKATPEAYKDFAPRPWVDHARRQLDSAEAFQKSLQGASEGVAGLPEGATNTAHEHQKACLLSSVRLKGVLEQAGRARASATQSRGGSRCQEGIEVCVSAGGFVRQEFPIKVLEESEVACEEAWGN